MIFFWAILSPKYWENCEEKMKKERLKKVREPQTGEVRGITWIKKEWSNTLNLAALCLPRSQMEALTAGDSACRCPP